MDKTKRNLYQERINQFLQRLKQLFYEDNITLSAEIRKIKSFVSFDKRLDGNYKPAKTGAVWGKDWQRAWFHITGTVPREWKGRSVCAIIDLGGEALVFDKSGTPVLGLSVHSIWGETDFRRDRIMLKESAKGGEKVDLWIEASAGQLFGLPINNDRGNHVPEKYGDYEAKVNDISIAVLRKDIWDLYLDCFVLNDLGKALSENSVRGNRIIYILSKAVDVFTAGPDDVKKAGKIVRSELDKKSSASDLSTIAVGHAHLDTAWLWPLSETIRKCGRTFSNQIGLIDKYPGYVFGASQAQLYAYTKEYYPSLYKKIKKKVAAGTWEVQGGMWVEADCNLIGGESMVRQVLHGKRFFKEEFNVDVKNCWLPDVFGYSAAMPQILKKSGIDYFVTQKLSWNQFNKIPFNTFKWRGIDGAEVIAHFPPENNYNSFLYPSKLMEARENFRENHFLDEFLSLYGIGDGGGGPSEEIIETGLRQKDLENCPKVEFNHAQKFLDRLGKKRDLLPLWSGELYFELHRGTLTTHAYIKKMNRYMELKLRELEIVYSSLLPEQYPSEKLDEMWKTVLLNQFHDIIPGSSITPVYEDCRIQYEGLRRDAGKLAVTAAEKIFKKDKDSVCMVNTLSCSYTRPVQLPENWAGYEVLEESGERIPCQIEDKTPVVCVNLPPLGIKTLKRGKKIKQDSNLAKNKKIVLENDLIRYTFSVMGTVESAYDKENGFEVLAKGQHANVLNLYEDRPVNWDAWDIDFYYENQLVEQARLTDIRYIAEGPVRKGLEICFAVGKSELTQKVYLTSGSKRLDFETKADWREDHKLLRVLFNLNIFSDTATFDIQYGNVKRNTHRNTSWDAAKFEVAAHRFADISDRDYGAALMNDCKYGYKVLNNEISLSLLRAPTMPDPRADRGEHEFTYSFLPHKGEFINSNVMQEASQLNQTAACFPGYGADGITIPYSINTEEVVLEAVKKSETDNSKIFRLYEPKGKKASAKITFEKTITTIYETDLMENNLRKLKLKDGRLDLDFKAFEIKTIKVVYKK